LPPAPNSLFSSLLPLTNRTKNDPSFTDFSGGFRVVLAGE
jgi:hypothetical protein